MARTVLVATAAAGAFLTGGLLGFSRTATAEVDRALDARQLVGSRYETMLALAKYLDETAQGALEGADDDVRHTSPANARFLSAIRAFAASARDLHGIMAQRQATSVELPSEVAALARSARLFGERIRAARALETIRDEWEAIADVLRRMELLLAGQDVEVPTAYVPALSASSLDELRRLASDLQAGAIRAHGEATRAVGKYRDRGQQFLGELAHFAVQSRDLKSRADAGNADPQRVGPMVDFLLEEARQSDRRLRDAHVFTEVWDDSARAITILRRMASLVRS